MGPIKKKKKNGHVVPILAMQIGLVMDVLENKLGAISKSRQLSIKGPNKLLNITGTW